MGRLTMLTGIHVSAESGRSLNNSILLARLVVGVGRTRGIIFISAGEGRAISIWSDTAQMAMFLLNSHLSSIDLLRYYNCQAQGVKG